ncbi:rhodanese-like domain-containing protein [Oxalobacteraceae bacterium CAVE-383]|nr:rhodanese-like domain-containing protein [Oxalobacteraceae bacterium CAVE-383]
MKFIIDNIFLIGLAILSGGALIIPMLQQRGGNKLTLLQATQLINQNKTVILDVRDEAQFAAGHIRDARNIPARELAKRVGELEKLKTRNFLVVCQSGTQAAGAAATLAKAGFPEVFCLTGGMSAWQAQSLPVVGGAAAAVKGAA